MNHDESPHSTDRGFYDPVWLPVSAQWLPATEAKEVALRHADVGPTPGLASKKKELSPSRLRVFPQELSLQMVNKM